MLHIIYVALFCHIEHAHKLTMLSCRIVLLHHHHVPPVPPVLRIWQGIR